MGSAAFIQVTQSVFTIAVAALHSTLSAQTGALLSLTRLPSLARPHRGLANTLTPNLIADHDATCLPLLAGSLTTAPVIGGIDAA